MLLLSFRLGLLVHTEVIPISAALLDAFNLPRAYREAKDSKDDLRVEMEEKFALGYPRTNILSDPPPAASSYKTDASS